MNSQGKSSKTSTQTASRKDNPRAAFRADIHGLRAVAVLVVLVYHAGLPLYGGYVGVDVFFVISGFLITNHLLRELSVSSTVSFANFYARRARRILPAALAVAAITVVGGLAVLPAEFFKSVVIDAIATVLYVPNFVFAIRGTDYLAETAASPFQHYWSLGVEEQFYLFWPLFLFLLWRISRSQRMRIAVIVVAVMVSFSFSVLLVDASPSWAYFSPASRAWELGVGALVAIAAIKMPFPRARYAAILAWTGLAGILLAAFLYDSETQFPGMAALVPVLGAAALVWFGGHAGSRGPLAVLRFRPVQFLGTISYSLYLVHWPLIVLLPYTGWFASDLIPAVSVLAALGSVVFAWLLFRFVESPFLRGAGSKLSTPRHSFSLALSASVVVILIALAAVNIVSLRPSDAGREAESLPAQLPELAFTPFVPSNLTPSLADASSSVPSIYGNDCHLGTTEESSPSHCVYGEANSATAIVLFGDSHAAQWFPALEDAASAHSAALYTFTKSSCPSVVVSVLLDNARYRSCDNWRDNVIDRVNLVKPNLVVISNFSNYSTSAGTELSQAEWRRGYNDLRERIAPEIMIAVVADTPRFSDTPALCLAQNLDSALSCSASRADALATEFAAADKSASREIEAKFVDLTSEFCDVDSCGVIRGSTLIYRDTHHITVEYSRILSDLLWRALSD